MDKNRILNLLRNWNAPKLFVIFLIASLIASILFITPSLFTSHTGALDNILKSGVLRVLTRNTSTTYYELQDAPAGYEYDLAQAFADHLNVKLELIVKPNIPELLESLNNGEADLVAAGITRTEERESLYRFAADYHTVQQQVVCAKDNLQIKSPEDLVGKNVAVITGSSYEETLNQWKQEFPKLEWISSQNLSTEQILKTVANGKLDCTVADSNITAVNRRYYPQLQMAFPASEAQQLAWVVPENASKLENRLNLWFQKIEENGLLASIKERYYGHVEFYDYVDTQVFMRRIKQRLPKYEKLFKKAADKYTFPWTLLAAQAYQESHWNPKAKSPTGVRGLMMLTQNTAKSVGVKSRLDPAQSITGGAKYLHKMMQQLPPAIKDENRLYYALAAYNIGMGHLKDAMKLAPSVGKNPYEWVELKEVLPLLSEKVFYQQLKHGYARGNEPVLYVTRIRNYEDILKNRFNVNPLNTSGSES